MRTLIVSDLHLGAPSRYPQADGELCRILWLPWERIILAGDVFDLWRSSYWAIRKVHTTLMETLAASKCPVIYIPGNHDEVFRGLTQLDGMQVVWPSYTFESGGKKVTVCHGDTYDDANPVLSSFGAWLGSAADRISLWFAGPGASIQRSVRHSFVDRGPGRESYARPVLEAAARDIDADLVVLGHTHLPSGPEEVAGRIVVNSGDFGSEHMTYVVVAEGKAELRDLQA